MTPKQQANKLIDEMYEHQLYSGEYNVQPLFERAKQCALITVDYLIMCTHSDTRANSKLDKEYWEKVKIAIENQKV